jgi:hypothetical protein
MNSELKKQRTRERRKLSSRRRRALEVGGTAQAGKRTRQLRRAMSRALNHFENSPCDRIAAQNILSRNAHVLVRRIQMPTKRRVKKMCSLSAPKLPRDRSRRELKHEKIFAW